MGKSLISCTVPSGPVSLSRIYNPLILLILGNNVEISVDGNRRVLNHNDILMVNQGSDFVCSQGNSLIVFSLNNSELKKALDGVRYSFICDSDNSLSGNYDRLRKLLEEILTLSFNRHPHKDIKLAQLFYELVFFLVQNFAIEEINYESGESDRLLNYLYNNYSEDISLESTAEYFGMTPQYFSKYFKKVCGENFLSCLTSIRLNYAKEELLNTDKKLISIAMDNGFNDLGTFNRCFKQHFGTSPLKYKEENKVASNDVKGSTELSVVLENINKQIVVKENEISLTADANMKKSYKPFWRKVLNFGNLNKIDSSNIKAQLESLQKDIGYEYIRVNLDLNNSNSSFTQEEYDFDILYTLGFKIWLEINIREINDYAASMDYIHNLLSYMTNRYGIHNIKNWFFELEYNTSFDKKKTELFIEYLNKLEKVLSEFGLSERIVIAGLSIGNFDGINYFYNELEKRKIEIKENSLVASPFVYFKDENGNLQLRPGDPANFIPELLNIRNSSYFKNGRNIYICSWKDNVHRLNVFNDSCYKGALMARNIIECFGLIDGFSADVPFDSMYDINLQKSVLFGGDGMISHHGITKPVYYALRFFNYAGNYYLNKNENAILFTNDSGNYHAICHNCKELNYRSYMDEEIDVANLSKYFVSDSALSIHIHIDNVNNGIYKIKIRTISSEYGSVQDELLRMCQSKDVFIHPNDVEYLKSVSVPRISLNQLKVDNSTIDLDIHLKANEFCLVHVVKTF